MYPVLNTVFTYATYLHVSMGTLVPWSGIQRRMYVEFTKNIENIFWRISACIMKVSKIRKGNMRTIYRKYLFYHWTACCRADNFIVVEEPVTPPALQFSVK
jgi:hypothetical protein